MIGFAIAATLCAGIFAGAAVYITLVEHPARLSCGTTLAHTEFIPSYKRATVLQAPLAVLGGLSGAAAWYLGAGTGWLVGGILLVSVIPITAFAILPTNNKLLATKPGQESNTIAGLLAKWGRLHAVRTVLGTAAFVLFVVLLTRVP